MNLPLTISTPTTPPGVCSLGSFQGIIHCCSTEKSKGPYLWQVFHNYVRSKSLLIVFSNHNQFEVSLKTFAHPLTFVVLQILFWCYSLFSKTKRRYPFLLLFLPRQERLRRAFTTKGGHLPALSRNIGILHRWRRRKWTNPRSLPPCTSPHWL
jgi:hypothetical protein